MELIFYNPLGGNTKDLGPLEMGIKNIEWISLCHEDFTDVTLVCEDGQQVEAHKVILANASPFFQNILRKNKHIHPLIYMRGIKSDDLLAIVDFLYCGETNMYPENLDSFLAIAEELQLKGLMGKSDKDEVIEKETFKTTPPKKVKPVHNEEPSAFGKQMESRVSDTLDEEGFSSGDLQELDEKCNSMMEKTPGKNALGKPLYQCNVSGKEEINSAIKSHIEANHLEGVSIPCNFCEKTFRSKNSLAMHTRRKIMCPCFHLQYFRGRRALSYHGAREHK